MKNILWFLISALFLSLAVSVLANGYDKYNVAYYEAGEFGVYTETWEGTKRQLDDMGLLGKLDVKYYESPGWDKDDKVHEVIAKKLMNDKDLDLIIGMGTKAVDVLLKNNNNKTPIIGMALSDALKSGFIKNVSDTGIDNFTTRYFPKRWLMLADTFYNLTKFKNIGLLFANTPEGHVYANYKQWTNISDKYGFKVSVRYMSEEETYEEVKRGLLDLINIDKIDAFYISAILPFDFREDEACSLLKLLADNKIQAFSRDGLPHIEKGALIGLTGTDWNSVGKFHARQIKEILIDKKKPREVNFIYNNRFTLAINLKTLKYIGFDGINLGHFHLFERVFTDVCWEE
jgi:ABC-type uncharacterized transport system substrate-binding protein